MLGGACGAAVSDPGPRVVQPGAPGEPSRAVLPTAIPKPSHVQADVEFMQGMIGHHAQALEMTALLEGRTGKEDIRLLALRIEVSQADEIRMMQGWLRAKGENAPDVRAHHEHGMLMPGMLTPDDMAQLAAATGAEFERLFLQFMISHHEGALFMVDALYSNPGAGQEETMSAFAGEVVADQGIEIRRMRGMLAVGR
jgi:uncharacterized protein (DUF305 family)